MADSSFYESPSARLRASDRVRTNTEQRQTRRRSLSRGVVDSEDEQEKRRGSFLNLLRAGRRATSGGGDGGEKDTDNDGQVRSPLAVIRSARRRFSNPASGAARRSIRARTVTAGESSNAAAAAGSGPAGTQFYERPNFERRPATGVFSSGRSGIAGESDRGVHHLRGGVDADRERATAGASAAQRSPQRNEISAAAVRNLLNDIGGVRLEDTDNDDDDDDGRTMRRESWVDDVSPAPTHSGRESVASRSSRRASSPNLSAAPSRRTSTDHYRGGATPTARGKYDVLNPPSPSAFTADAVQVHGKPPTSGAPSELPLPDRGKQERARRKAPTAVFTGLFGKKSSTVNELTPQGGGGGGSASSVNLGTSPARGNTQTLNSGGLGQRSANMDDIDAMFQPRSKSSAAGYASDFATPMSTANDPSRVSFSKPGGRAFEDLVRGFGIDGPKISSEEVVDELYNPERFLGANELHTFGLGGTANLFAVDPLLHLFFFCTSNGDLKVVSPVWEFLVRNISPIKIDLIEVVPGTGRIITAGTLDPSAPQPTQAYLRTTADGKSQSLLQVWDVSMFMSNEKPPPVEEIRPVTMNLPFAVQVLERCCIHRSGETSAGSPTSASSPPAKSATSGPASGSSSSSYTRRSSANVITNQLLPFGHPEGSASPMGDPREDSRWLFYVGTNDGELRIFDCFAMRFLDYLVKVDMVIENLVSLKVLQKESTTAPWSNHSTHPVASIRAIAPHPSDAASVLIGYENAVIIEWNFRTSSVVGYSAPKVKPLAVDKHGSPQGTVILPNNIQLPVGRPFLHSMAWHPAGHAFACAVSGALYGHDHRGREVMSSCSDSRILVFGRTKASPYLFISLEHVSKAHLQNCILPTMHWESSNLRVTAHVSASTLTKDSQLYLLSTPFQPRTAGPEATRMNSSSSSGGTSMTRGGGGGRSSGHSNVWKFSGHLWANVYPVFPHGAVCPASPPSCSVLAARILKPSPDQMPASSGCPFVGALTGLRLIPDLNKDQGEDAETVIAAARKLMRYLMAGTFVIVITNFPSRQLLGACIKIHGTVYKTLKRLYPSIMSGSGKRSDDGSEDEDDSDEEEDVDFAPWESLTQPLLFQVEWQSLLLSNVTSFHMIPRYFRSSAKRVQPCFHTSQDFSPMDQNLFHRMCGATILGRQGLLTMADIRKAFDSEYCLDEASKERLSTQNDSLDALVDALYTVRKKQTVHAWLAGLSSRPHRMFIGCISTDADDPSDKGGLRGGGRMGEAAHTWGESASERKSAPQKGKQDATTDSDSDLENSDDDDDDDDDDDSAEWTQLNERLFFGDLLRITRSTWGSKQPILGAYQGLLITGHSDGKVRLWVYLSGALHMIHCLSIQSFFHYYPYAEPLVSSPSHRAGLTNHQQERADTQSIGSVNTKPVVACMPELSVITSIEIFIQGLSDEAGPTKAFTDLGVRCLVTGCLTGEVIVFKWSATSASLPAPELAVFWDMVRKKMSGIGDDALSSSNGKKGRAPLSVMSVQEDVDSSALPFGFHCYMRHTAHKTRVTCIAITCVYAAVSDSVRTSNPRESAPAYGRTSPNLAVHTDETTSPDARRRGRSGTVWSAPINVVKKLQNFGQLGDDDPPQDTPDKTPITKKTSAIGLRAAAASPPPESTGKIAWRMLVADKSGCLSIVNLENGQVVLFVSLGGGDGDEGSRGKKNNNASSSSTASSGDSPSAVEIIMAIDRPILFSGSPTDKDSFGYQFTQTLDTPSPFGEGTPSDPLLLLGTSGGGIRQVDLSKALLLEDFKYTGQFDPRGTGTVTGCAGSVGGNGGLEPSVGTKKWYLLKEVKIDSGDFMRFGPGGEENDFSPVALASERAGARTLYVRKEAFAKGKEIRTDSFRWIACVQSHWVGLIEIKAEPPSGPTKYYTYTQCKGYDSERETSSASLSFIDNTPCMVVLQRGGTCAVFAIHVDIAGFGLTFSQITKIDFLDNLPVDPPNQRNTYLNQLNLAGSSWDSKIIFARKDKSGMYPCYWGSALSNQRALDYAWRHLTSYQFRLNVQMAAKKHRLAIRPASTSQESLKSPIQRKETKRSAGLLGKVAKWTGQPSSDGTAAKARGYHLRKFVDDAAREVLASSIYRQKGESIPFEFEAQSFTQAQLRMMHPSYMSQTTADLLAEYDGGGSAALGGRDSAYSGRGGEASGTRSRAVSRDQAYSAAAGGGRNASFDFGDIISSGSSARVGGGGNGFYPSRDQQWGGYEDIVSSPEDPRRGMTRSPSRAGSRAGGDDGAAAVGVRSSSRRKSLGHALTAPWRGGADKPSASYDGSASKTSGASASRSSQGGKVDAWSAARDAKVKVSMNVEQLRNTADKTDEMRVNAQEMSSLATQLRQKYQDQAAMRRIF